MSLSTVRKVFLFLLSIGFYSQTAWCQDGYSSGYVLQQGDTIKGYVKQKNKRNGEILVLFKAEKKSATQTFGIDLIEGYGHGEFDQYRKLNLRNQLGFESDYFGKILVEGPTALYAVRNGYLLVRGNTKEYLSASNSRGLEAKKARIRKLGAFFSGCRNPLLDNVNPKLPRGALVRVTKAYNDCMGQNSSILDYDPNGKNLHLSYGLSAGIDVSRLTFGQDNEFDLRGVDFGYSRSSIIGVKVLISSQRYLKNTGLYIEAQYKKANYYGYQRQDGLTPGINMDASIETNQLRILVGPSFQRSAWGIKYFLQSGFSVNNFFDTTTDFVEETIQNDGLGSFNIFRFQSSPEFLTQEGNLGFWAKLELRKALKSIKFDMALGVLYNTYSNASGFSPTFNDFQLTFSLYRQ